MKPLQNEKIYVNLLAKAGYGYPNPEPSPGEKPFLRPGDVLYNTGESSDWRVERLMNIALAHDDPINKSEIFQVPASFDDIRFNVHPERGVSHTSMSSPVTYFHDSGSVKRIHIEISPSLKVSIDISTEATAENNQFARASVAFQPMADVLYYTVLQRFLRWIADHHVTVDGCAKSTGINVGGGLLYVYKTVMSDRWAMCLSQPEDHNLEFKVAANVMSVGAAGVEWGKWESTMKKYTKTSPPRNDVHKQSSSSSASSTTSDPTIQTATTLDQCLFFDAYKVRKRLTDKFIKFKPSKSMTKNIVTRCDDGTLWFRIYRGTQALGLYGENPSTQGGNNRPGSGGGPPNQDPDGKHNRKEGGSGGSSNDINGGTGTLSSGQREDSSKSGPAGDGSSKTQGHILVPRDELVDSGETEISSQDVLACPWEIIFRYIFALYDVDYAIVSTLEFVHILMMAEGSGFKNSLGFWLVKNKPRIKILTSTDNVKFATFDPLVFQTTCYIDENIAELDAAEEEEEEEAYNSLSSDQITLPSFSFSSMNQAAPANTTMTSVYDGSPPQNICEDSCQEGGEEGDDDILEEGDEEILTILGEGQPAEMLTNYKFNADIRL